MQAHFINNRSMEVFRPLDGLAAEVAAQSPPLAEWRKFVYCESLTGRIFGEVDHFQVTFCDAAADPTWPGDLEQNEAVIATAIATPCTAAAWVSANGITRIEPSARHVTAVCL